MGNHYERAQALFRMKRYKEAASEYQEELAENPNSVLALAGLASSTLNLGNYFEAANLIRQVIGLSPTYAYGFYLLSFTESDLNRPAAAIDAIKEAIRLSPTDPDYHHRLAHIYYYQSQFNEALAATTAAMELDPHHLPSILLRGNTLIKLHRTDEAKALLRIALTTDPEHPEAHYQLGKLELARGSNSEAALELLTEARRLDPLTKNDSESIALAYGRLIRPFVWIDRIVIRWLNWPVRTEWLAVFLITAATIIYTVAAGPADPTRRAPVHVIAMFYAATILLNYFVFTISFDQIASDAAKIVARRKVGASWKQSSDALVSIFGFFILHAFTTGFAVLVAWQPFVVPILTLPILNAPVLFAFPRIRSKFNQTITTLAYLISIFVSYFAAATICFGSSKWFALGLSIMIIQMIVLYFIGSTKIRRWNSTTAIATEPALPSDKMT